MRIATELSDLHPPSYEDERGSTFGRVVDLHAAANSLLDSAGVPREETGSKHQSLDTPGCPSRLWTLNEALSYRDVGRCSRPRPGNGGSRNLELPDPDQRGKRWSILGEQPRVRSCGHVCPPAEAGSKSLTQPLKLQILLFSSHGCQKRHISHAKPVPLALSLL